MRKKEPIISLVNLFLQFLKIGATSFGGFMALISMVEKQFVERKELIKSDALLDAISVASVLPGPMAVNVVAFVGYKLKGMRGAMVSMLGVLLPTVILIIFLSHLYFQYGNLPQVDAIFKGIVPAVCAIVLAVAINMARKNLSDYRQILMCVVGGIVYILVGGFFITLILLIVSGVLGIVFFGESKISEVQDEQAVAVAIDKPIWKSNRMFFLSVVGISAIIFILPWIFPGMGHLDFYVGLRKLYLTFSGVSLTLFGGGYVFIPMLQELVVDQLHWVTSKEFIDGIALGQVTPGPIMISAAFIGYKVAGITGAIISTIAMFLPPALLMIIVSSFIDELKNSRLVNAAFKGIRPVVIGMIFAAVWIIGQSIGFEVIPLMIFVGVFILTYWLKVNVVYLIPISGLVGLIVF